MEHEHKTAALILSGGKSRRMGKDKTTVEYKGEPFIIRAVRFWKEIPGVSRIYLSIGSREHLEKIRGNERLKALFEDDQAVFVTDIYKDCGPMAGIHAAFSAGEEEWLYVCAVDMLSMNRAAVLQRGSGEKDAYVYTYDGKNEPLFALYSRRILPAAERMLKSGHYKLQELLETVDTEYVEASEEQQSVFFNCNTPEDLEKLK